MHACSHEFEHRVLNDIVCVGTLEAKRLTAESRVIETVTLRSQYPRISHLALYRHHRETQCIETGICSGPALPPPGVGRVSNTGETDIDPRIGNRVEDLLMGAAQHFG